MPFQDNELKIPTPRNVSPTIPIPTSKQKGGMPESFAYSFTEHTFFYDCIQGNMKRIKAYSSEEMVSVMWSLRAGDLIQQLINSCKKQDDNYAKTLSFLAHINFQLVKDTISRNLQQSAVKPKQRARTTLLQNIARKIQADFKQSQDSLSPPSRSRGLSQSQEEEGIFHLELDEEAPDRNTQQKFR